jgi:hypothetical protein
MKEDSNDSADIASHNFYLFTEIPKIWLKSLSNIPGNLYSFFVVFFSKDVEHLQKIHTMPG